MLVDANTPSTSKVGVTAAIQQASQLTGTNFQYLLATAKVESNLNPRAAAATSSAGGLFQFIEQTWLGTLKQAGASLGYSRYAEAIRQTGSGRYVVSDPSLRSEILKLRQDPTANAVMAGALTKSNAAVLTQKLGRPPTESELYVAHFLGARGAAKLIGLAAATPSATAASAFPQAAQANRSIFFAHDGRPRSFADVTRVLAGRYDVARASDVAPAEAAAPPRMAFAVEREQVARAYETVAPLAVKPAASTVATRTIEDDDAQFMFRNPYRSPERRAERARSVTPEVVPQRDPSVVPTTSTVRPVTQVASTARTATVNNEPLGLFQDFRPNVRALFTGG